MVPGSARKEKKEPNVSTLFLSIWRRSNGTLSLVLEFSVKIENSAVHESIMTCICRLVALIFPMRNQLLLAIW